MADWCYSGGRAIGALDSVAAVVSALAPEPHPRISSSTPLSVFLSPGVACCQWPVQALRLARSSGPRRARAARKSRPVCRAASWRRRRGTCRKLLSPVHGVYTDPPGAQCPQKGAMPVGGGGSCFCAMVQRRDGTIANTTRSSSGLVVEPSPLQCVAVGMSSSWTLGTATGGQGYWVQIATPTMVQSSGLKIMSGVCDCQGHWTMLSF